MGTTSTNFREIAEATAVLVESKDAAYGNSFDVAGEFLKTLYPHGIKPEQYGDMLALVRIYDKMKRIASGDSSENSWGDITGYGLLGQRRVIREHNAYKEAMRITQEKIDKLKFKEDESSKKDPFDMENLKNIGVERYGAEEE